MTPQRGAAIGAVVVVLALAWAWVQLRHREMRRAYEQNAQVQVERVERIERPPPAPPPEVLTWAWVGGEAWPRLSAVNDACAALHRCNDVPGPARAACLEPRLANCEDALTELAALEMRSEADGLFLWRLAQERSALCVYRVNLRALQEQPGAFARVQPGTSTEETINDAADRGRPRALIPYDAEMATCIVENDAVLGETDGYLRGHFGCEQVRADGVRGIPQCCTAARVGRMYAAGFPPLPADPGCT